MSFPATDGLYGLTSCAFEATTGGAGPSVVPIRVFAFEPASIFGVGEVEVIGDGVGLEVGLTVGVGVPVALAGLAATKSTRAETF